MSVTSFRGFPLVDGAISANDTLYLMIPPFYSWSLVIPISAVVSSFMSNAAFGVGMTLSPALSTKHLSITQALNIDDELLDSAIKIKHEKFVSSINSEKVN